MIFRLSQKLNTKIKAGKLTEMPINENPFADWSCHLFTADRTQYIILCNTKSLYSTVMFGKGITNDSQFIETALNTIREFMEQEEQESVYHRFVTPASNTVNFAKALNRSVTGSMNDLIFHAQVWMIEDGVSPHEVGFKLNDIPMSALGEPRGYGKPNEAFYLLLSENGET